MVRFGIIGTGGVAAGGATDLAANPDAELIAVADPSRERVTAFADRFGVSTVLESAEQLVALDAVDAVYIAVPNYLHAAISTMALQAGKHVLQEKPLALSLADAAPLAAAARQSGKHFMLGMNQRFAPPVQRARQLVEQGRIGRPYHCKAYWRRRTGIPGIGSWFTRKELSGGGGLLDIGVHMLDNALYLLDNFRPRSVSGATYTEFGNRGLGEGGWGMSARAGEQFDVDDFATAVIKLDGGATVLIEAAWAMHLDRTNDMNVELYGTEGAIDTYGERLYRQEADGYHVIQVPDAGELTYPHASRMHHFVNVILGREEPCVTLDQVLSVQRVLDAIYRSAATGREVVIQ
jgi:predicted dehydrogenase